MDNVKLALLSVEETILQMRRYFLMINAKAGEIRNSANQVTRSFNNSKRDPYNKTLLDKASQIVLSSRDKIKNDRISVASLKVMTEKIFWDNSKHPITGLNILINIAEIELQQLNALTIKTKRKMKRSIKLQNRQTKINSHQHLMKENMCKLIKS